MTAYQDVFTGSIVEPTDVSYNNLTLSANLTLVWPNYFIPTAANTAVAARNSDVTATLAGLSIALPIGAQGAPGTDLLFTNRGAIAFLVTDSAGLNSTLVAPGASIYFYLQDNSTSAGTWKSTQFGTGTSSADANLLAGNGLRSFDGKLVESLSVVQFLSSGYNLFDTDRAKAYVWMGGVGTLPLPAPNTLTTGWFIYLRNQGTGTLTVATQGTSLLNGSSLISIEIGTAQLIVFDSNSNNFFSFGTINSQNFAFSSATYDTSSIITNTYSLVSSAPLIQRYVDLSGSRTTNLLVVLPAIANEYALINATGSTTYTLSFQLSGSSQTPIVVAPNTQAFVASDGISLYVLNATLLGAIQLNAGTPQAPTLSFIGEATTGLYKPSPFQIGLTTGGQNLVVFNGSDRSNPQIVAPTSTAVFKTISGGLI